jgi:hypothetical protein
MADKDTRGKELAQRVRDSEAKLQKEMSGSINPARLEKARKENARATEAHRAWESGRSYGSGAGGRDNGE